VLADGLESADDEQRTPKADPMDVDEPGSGGRYPTSKLFQTNPQKYSSDASDKESWASPT